MGRSVKKQSIIKDRCDKLCYEIWLDSLSWMEKFLLASKSKNADLIIDQVLTLRESLQQETEKLQEGEDNG